jgi:hypothetical protein
VSMWARERTGACERGAAHCRLPVAIPHGGRRGRGAEVGRRGQVEARCEREQEAAVCSLARVSKSVLGRLARAKCVCAGVCSLVTVSLWMSSSTSSPLTAGAHTTTAVSTAKPRAPPRTGGPTVRGTGESDGHCASSCAVTKSASSCNGFRKRAGSAGSMAAGRAGSIGAGPAGAADSAAFGSAGVGGVGGGARGAAAGCGGCCIGGCRGCW